MSRRRKGVLIIVGIVLFLLAALFFTVTDSLREAVAVEVGSVDLSGVADGSYTGRYDFKRWSTTVRVEVRSHRIEDIVLLKDVRAAELTDCADEIFRRVLEAQNTQVDAITGATATSKAYLKAIETALNNGEISPRFAWGYLSLLGIKQLFWPPSLAQGQGLRRAMMNATITVLAFLSLKNRIALGVPLPCMVRTAPNASSTPGAMIPMQEDREGDQLARQFVGGIDYATYPKMRDISFLYTGCVQPAQKYIAVPGNLFPDLPFELEEPADKRHNQ